MHGAEQASLAATIDARLQLDPLARCMVFLQGDGRTLELTRQALRAAIHASAQALQKGGLGAGDVVALAFEHTWELIPAFLGAIHLGAVPVILPYLGTISGHMLEQQIRGLVATCQARAVATLPHYRPQLAFLDKMHLPQIELAVTLAAPGAFIPVSPRAGDALAHLQLSSGTTSQPKAVMVTHRTLLAGVAGIIAGLPLTAADVSVGWLPLHHDLGLLFQVIVPLVGGMQSVCIAPDYWVRRPRSLLQAVHRYRGTYTGMPNFAFNHCVRTIRDSDLDGIDLSSWRLVLNGAEIIYLESFDTFYARFAPYGLRHTALRSIYGMTENTCTITMMRPTADNEAWRADWVTRRDLLEQGVARPAPATAGDAGAVVSCGHPLPDTELRIVDETGVALPDRRVGEILLHSPYLNLGYFARPDLMIAGPDGWFATGDLGYLVDGELFICGRKKDLIVTAGKHILPTAIEVIAVGVLGERAGDMAAFGVANRTLGTELPVLICEVRGKYDAGDAAAWATQIRRRVHMELNLALADIRFVRRGWLVQTTSAKIIRTASRDKYLAEYGAGVISGVSALPVEKAARPELPTTYCAPRNDLEEELATVWAALLNLDRVGIFDNFFELGGDSIQGMRMAGDIEQRLGIAVPSGFFGAPTIAELAAAASPTLCARSAASEVGVAGPDDAAVRAAPVHAPAARPPLRNINARLVRRGPVISGHAIPYAQGFRLQRLWLRYWPGLLRNHLVELARWRHLTATAEEWRQVVEVSLAANTWVAWRRRALKSPAAQARWMINHGLDLFADGRRPQKVILVDTHSLAQSAGQLAAALHTADYVHLVSPGPIISPQWNAAVAQQMFAARDLLEQGVPVVMASDGYGGVQGIDVPFFGHMRRFRSGAAELAVQSGAALVPFFATLRADGTILNELLPPLGGISGSHAAQVEHLTRQYADLYIARWRALLPNLPPANILLLNRELGLSPQPAAQR